MSQPPGISQPDDHASTSQPDDHASTWQQDQASTSQPDAAYQTPAPPPTTTWYGSDTQRVPASNPWAPPGAQSSSPWSASAPWSASSQPASTQTAPSAPSGPVAPGFASGQPRASRRILELGTVAVLAAVLSGGGVYAAVSSSTPGSTGTTNSAFTPNTAQPVVQANAQAPDWTATAAAVSPSVVAITIASGGRSVGQGSGVILDSAGRIITNNHVATAAGTGKTATLSVTLDDKRTYDATIVGTDAATDLAVIQIKDAPSDLKPVALGDDRVLKVGDPVMAVGNPLGLAGTVTTGIVSALNRPVSTSDSEQDPFGSTTSGNEVVTNAVQTSAAINPGNSGGALVNANGQLVGINSSIASTGSSGGNIGIGFAIPVTEAKSVAEQLIATGKAKHAYLGVTPSSVVVADGNAKRAAAGIQSVASNTPASKAGLKSGDAVVSVDGETVDSALALVAQIRERSVNDKVTLTIVRGGERQDISVTLEERTSS